MFDSLARTRPGPGPRVIAAVFARDRTCTFPGCTVPAFRCDLDRVVRSAPRAPGTDVTEEEVEVEDVISLCRHHHVVRARDGWRPEIGADGAVRWTSPTGHRYVHEHPEALGGPAAYVLRTGTGP